MQQKMASGDGDINLAGTIGSGPALARLSAKRLVDPRCSTTKTAADRSRSKPLIRVRRASRPPADPPMTMMSWVADVAVSMPRASSPPLALGTWPTRERSLRCDTVGCVPYDIVLAFWRSPETAALTGSPSDGGANSKPLFIGNRSRRRARQRRRCRHRSRRDDHGHRSAWPPRARR
jgi:hypothetical protein